MSMRLHLPYHAVYISTMTVNTMAMSEASKTTTMTNTSKHYCELDATKKYIFPRTDNTIQFRSIQFEKFLEVTELLKAHSTPGSAN